MPNNFARTGSFERYIKLCLWLLVAGLFFSLARQWVALTSSDRQLTEYVESLLRRSAIDHRRSKEIRTLVLVRAEQLSIPLQFERINVTGQGETLRTDIAYDTAIKFPLVDRALYRMEFSHSLGSTE